MKLRSTYRGGDQPFEGDRSLLLGGIPSNARILRATAKVLPIDATNGLNPFAETIPLHDGAGFGGATQAIGADFIEVDFHARRTLAGVTGSKIEGTSLQVDMGGIFVEINERGAIKGPPPDGSFIVAGNGALPGLTVNKFKLTQPPASEDTPPPPPPLSAVTIRSVPSNVSLKLGALPPFWTHPGEQSQSETSPDFAEILQAFLLDAEIENGFYVIPLVLHSDTIGRLEITLEIDYLCQAEVLPEGLNEVTLPFDFASLPKTDAELLQVSLPANVRVVQNKSRSRLVGAFDESRIMHGSTGVVTPVAALDVSPVVSRATFISLEASLSVTAIDLLLTAVTRSAGLQLDLREDLDGKPDNASILPQAVKFTLDRNASGQAVWISVSLQNAFQFLDQGQRRYWLVIQSLEGDALWSVEAGLPGRPGMQLTRDGGFSWREARASDSKPLSAFFRLRQTPERFQMPIELEVGRGKAATRVAFDRFQATGRVEFSLDLPELSEAFNRSLSENSSTSSCPEAEHLTNGNFKEWLRLGENVANPTNLDLGEGPLHTPTVVALSPDGAWAYVGSFVTSGSGGGLIVIDAVCDKVIDRQILDPSGRVNALVINALGSRAYVISGGSRLILIDTSTHRSLGSFIDIRGVRALALSPDDRRLYVATATQATQDNPATIQIFDTEKLEALVLGAEASNDLEIILEMGEPMALVLSPDGRRLYVAFSEGLDADGKILVFDTATRLPIGSAIPVGKDPRDIVLTPDGKLLVVANTGDNTLHFIDTGRGELSGDAMPVGGRPQALSISPDGARVFVSNGAEAKLGIIDLISRRLDLIDIGQKSLDVAITPDGGKVFVVGFGDPDFSGISASPHAALPSLLSIQIGARQPDMWSPFGWLRPRCLDNPFQAFAELGLAPEGKASIPTSLSQVVPVKASCRYDFSFLGQATEADTLAEVMWLREDGGLLRIDEASIEIGWGNEEKDFSPREDPHPLLHRRHLIAPENAVQAEIRFSVPAGVLAVVGDVSLAASAETVLNSDFRLQKALGPEAWSFLPEAPFGFSVTTGAQGTQLRNAGSGPVTLIQTVQAAANEHFSLVFQGQAKPLSPAQSKARIEVHWQTQEGFPSGAPMSMEILSTDFNHHQVDALAPPDTFEGEIRLLVPAKTTLEVERVSLRPRDLSTVPLTFVAQAPGELTVSDWRVAYDQGQALAPPIPEKGLFFATPPGRRPGEAPCDLCFCVCCKTEQRIKTPRSMITETGHPAVAGRCPDCNAGIIRFGGQRAVAEDLIPVPKKALRLAPFRFTAS